MRAGEPVENAEIIRFARLFNDELTLDNLDRLQLVGMCQFVGISTLGTDTFLRSRLRAHLQQIKADDWEIENEGACAHCLVCTTRIISYYVTSYYLMQSHLPPQGWRT